MPNYVALNSLVIVANFITFLDDLLLHNKAVANKLNLYRMVIAQRQELYAGDNGLQLRFVEIRNYLAAKYGKRSSEYLTSLKIKY